MINDNVVIILSPQKWMYPYVSKHYYTLELLKAGATVYYINPPSGSNNISIEESSEHPRLNLVNYGYGVLYPAKFHIPTVFRLLTNKKLARIKKLIGRRVNQVWCFDNTGQYSDLTVFEAEKVLFFPVDTIASMQKAIKGVNYIFTISKEIQNSLEYDCPQYVIDHGLNDTFVSSSVKSIKTSEPELSIGSNRKIQVAMVGNLLIECLDITLLKQLIGTYPDIQFNFFGNYIQEGKLATKLSFLTRNNVSLHGIVPSQDLVKKFQSIDIFILTYKRTNIFKCDNSHKILEYLSSGKSVVSTYIERYKEEDVLYMLRDENNAKYIDLFDSVYNNLDVYNGKDERDRRIDYAIKFSYENNLRFIQNKILN